MILKYIFADRKAGAIAQSVEQRTENPCVPGSIPGGTTLILDNQMITRIRIKKRSRKLKRYLKMVSFFLVLSQ